MNAPATAVPGAEQPQCQFFVLRKKRLCRMTVRPGRQYCGEHEPQPPADLLEADKRIPCPNDPKHTCYASKLEKHLAKCNARQTEDPPYIVRNINAPEDAAASSRVPLKDVPAHTLRLVIDKINQLYDKHVLGTITSWQAPERHHSAVEASIQQAERGDSSRRHLRQASRLMQLAEECNLVQDHTCYVELGAGKGMLSYYMGRSWCAGGSSRVVCVDRAALRHKRDNLLPAGAAARLRADLRHLDLARSPLLSAATALVAVAKHLCGVATDYALRCVCGAGVVHRTRGVLLATCCHHRCEPGAYVATHKLEELGISREELNVMFGVVSWATCGDGRSRDRRAREQAGGGGEEHGGRGGTEVNSDKDTDEQIDDINDGAKEIDGVDGEAKTKKPKLAAEQSIDDRKEDGQVRNLTNDIENTTRGASVHQVCKDNSDSNQTTKVTSDIHVNNISNGNNKYLLDSKDTKYTFQPLDIKTREEIGRRAKALLDHGRVLYLRDLGFEASLCYYVPTTESLENVAIVASKLVAGGTGG